MLALEGGERNCLDSRELEKPLPPLYLELLDVTEEHSELVLLLLEVILDREGGLYGESRCSDAGGELVLEPVAGGLFTFFGRFFDAF